MGDKDCNLAFINNCIKRWKAVEELEAGKISDGYHTFDELYEHRCTLFVVLAKLLQERESATKPVWRSERHSDGSRFKDWFILGIFYETGNQITYHLPIAMWEQCAFAVTLTTAPEWDMHSSKDVLNRLLNL